MPQSPIFRDAFSGPQDATNPNLGVRPVVFDILAPDLETSVLPDNYKLVLHLNPTSLSPTYAKEITRINTRGGTVEQHWGEAARTISIEAATGGFMRLYSGLSNITGGMGSIDVGGTRRETLAYDRYLDLLALFHNNGSVYDSSGKIVFQGIIHLLFDGGSFYGWFNSFSVSEAAEKAYQFNLNAEFTIDHEVHRFRSPYAGGL